VCVRARKRERGQGHFLLIRIMFSAKFCSDFGSNMSVWVRGAEIHIQGCRSYGTRTRSLSAEGLKH
jgi:hypothetical protein